MDYRCLVELGIKEGLRSIIAPELEAMRRDCLERLVVRLAKLAQASGLDGVITPAQYVGAIVAFCGPGFIVVAEDLCSFWAKAEGQPQLQKSKETTLAGADYLLIGRPISQLTPEVVSSTEVVKCIREKIKKVERGA